MYKTVCGLIICKAVRRQTKFSFKNLQNFTVYKIKFVTESSNYILELIITLFRLMKFEIALVQAQVEAKIKDSQRKNKEQAFFCKWYWNEHSHPNFYGEHRCFSTCQNTGTGTSKARYQAYGANSVALSPEESYFKA